MKAHTIPSLHQPSTRGNNTVLVAQGNCVITPSISNNFNSLFLLDYYPCLPKSFS